MAPQESRLMRDTTQIALNMRTIHRDALRAGLPMHILAESAAAQSEARDMFNDLVEWYLRQLAHFHPLQGASDSARPRTQ